MSRSFTDSFREALYAPETDEVFTVLVEIDHADLSAPVRVASDWLEDLPISGGKGVISNGTEYIAFPFEFILPDQNETGVSRAQLRIDNVSREIMISALSISTPASVNVKIVLSSDPDTVELELDGFKLKNLTADAFAIQGDLLLTTYDLEPFPSGRFTPSQFAGLF